MDFFFFDQDGGTGMKNLMRAPTDGKVNRCCLASAKTDILYSLYLSIRRSRLNPGGFNLFLGIRNRIRSPTVLLIWVCGVIDKIYFLSIFRVGRLFFSCALTRIQPTILYKNQLFRIFYQYIYRPALRFEQ